MRTKMDAPLSVRRAKPVKITSTAGAGAGAAPSARARAASRPSPAASPAAGEASVERDTKPPASATQATSEARTPNAARDRHQGFVSDIVTPLIAVDRCTPAFRLARAPCPFKLRASKLRERRSGARALEVGGCA